MCLRSHHDFLFWDVSAFVSFRDVLASCRRARNLNSSGESKKSDPDPSFGKTTHPRSFLTYLELLEVEVAHFTEAERSGLLGEIEERELQGGAPREGKVPGRCALDLVHLAQSCRGIREGLTTRQEVRPLHCAREAPVENIDVGFDSKREREREREGEGVGVSGSERGGVSLQWPASLSPFAISSTV